MGQEERSCHSFNISQGTETPRIRKIIISFVQKGDVLAPQVLLRISVAEDICEASQRKNGKQGHKTRCPYDVALTTVSSQLPRQVDSTNTRQNPPQTY